ncbi:MAG: glycosyltransferase [Bacillota bacterium]|nr:glycosyltransferase [Bacillota bacterium]MDW7676544.1 glycosyltransferase [Bacillota bacterium]
MIKPGTHSKVILLIPPFYSHFNPLLALSKAFAMEGWEVIVGTGESFSDQVKEAGLFFQRVDISRNANTGIAADTQQAEVERQRLEAFFEATYQGPEETLLIQSLHRRDDMLTDPEGLMRQIQKLEELHQPDLWVVDQLSYGATLAMKCLNLAFISFCPPHPYSIPTKETLFGVPVRWPSSFQPDPDKMRLLENAAREARQTFTDFFNSTLARFGQPASVKNAFSETSPLAVVYMYPPAPAVLIRDAAKAPHLEDDGRKPPKTIYAGHCFEPLPIPEAWQEKMTVFRTCRPRILLSFGTFLSRRADLLEKSLRWIREAYPDSGILVAAGGSEKELTHLQDDRTLVEGLIPQKTLYPEMDLVIHHGGCNTFTECLYFGKPMIIVPFSSDQFHIAADGEHMGVAAVLNPQVMTREALFAALQVMLTPASEQARSHWQRLVQSRGPSYACREVMQHIDPGRSF